MPRPKLQTKIYRFDINMTLREGEDDDLIEFFQSIPKRSRVLAVKTALRSGKLKIAVQSDLPEDDELADALDDLMF
ncbi:MAG: hypothetical protein AAF702_28950 [Chloroflexota bacterium]